MAEVVPGWMPPASMFRFNSLDLDDWYDGQAWRLVPGVDYPADMSEEMLRNRLKANSRWREACLRIWFLDDGSCMVQAEPRIREQGFVPRKGLRYRHGPPPASVQAMIDAGEVQTPWRRPVPEQPVSTPEPEHTFVGTEAAHERIAGLQERWGTPDPLVPEGEVNGDGGAIRGDIGQDVRSNTGQDHE